MEKLIAAVFKTMGFSIVLIVLLDTSMFMTDVLTTLTRYNAIVNNMQTEIARYNGLPVQSLRDFYATQLVNEVDTRSTVITGIKANFSADNWTGSGVDADGNDILGTAMDKAKTYGKTQNLAITLTVAPIAYVYEPEQILTTKKIETLPTIDVTFNYKVPCLRYTKDG